MPYDTASDAEFVFRIEARNRERLHNDFLREFAGQQPDWGPLGYVTFKRTYARRLTSTQRTCREQFGVRHGATSTEEFWEALRRVTEGTFSVLRQQVRQSGQRWDEAEAQEKMRVMFRLMWEGKFLPPGRGLGMMGSEAVEKKGGACLFNCGMVGTANIDLEFAAPFVMLMDYSMLGVGMGFDTQGAGKIRIQTPVYEDVAHVIPDSREGWCGALERLLNAFVGKGSIPSWDFSQIRPEGAPIHTFGGTASGEGPLKELLYGVELILADVQGKVITSTVIVDIQNMIGRCVVAGNVRRSAEIALGSPDDEAFLALKDPSALIALDTEQRAIARDNAEWTTLEKQITEARASIQGRSALDPEVLPVERDIRAYVKAQKELLKTLPAWQQLENRVQAHPLRKYRWASNNTVMCGLDQDYTELAKQTVSNGEPGYAWPEVMRNYGRLSDPKNTLDAKAIGTNPCVPSGTRILTRDGYREIQTLVGQKVDVWNGEVWSAVEPKVTGRDQPLVRVKLSNGAELTCTSAHKWVLESREAPGREWRLPACDLRAGMALRHFDLPVVSTDFSFLNHVLSTRGRVEGEDVIVGKSDERPWYYPCHEHLVSLSAYGIQGRVVGDVLVIPGSYLHRLVREHGFKPAIPLPPASAVMPCAKVTVESVTEVGVADVVYCFTDPLAHRGTFEGIVTANCGEQTLWDAELCNLVETFPTRHNSLDEYKLTLKYAYLFAKVVTCIPTHNPTTNAVIARNRRIGLSMAGIWEMYENLGLRQCTRWWGESYAYIKELDEDYSGWMGIGRSIKVTSVKPGGCRPWYALTTTDQGILTLEEMLRDHPEDMQWAEIKTGANAVQGAGQKSRLAKTYVNGKAQVLRVTLSYGLEIESTPNHQWFVTSREDRTRKDRYPVVNEWRRTDELQEGDILEVVLSTYQKETHAALHRVNSVAIKMRNDATRIAQPSEMNPDLAWLLGYLWGDGAQSPAQFRLRFSDASTVNLDKVSRVLREQFGVETESRQRTAPERTDHVVEVGSKMLWHWLIRNGVWKYFGDKIDVIPEVVRTSSREDILAFLAGLLDSDGCASLSASGGKAIWTTADRAFASHVQHVGWAVGLGLGRSLQMLGASFQGEREMYHLTLGTKVDPSAFARLRQHSTKLTRLENDPRFTGWNWDKEDVKSLIVGKVKKIEALGEMDTYDVEVENTHWFYAGAVKSHNTIPLLLGIEGGMKMPISRHYMRTIRIEAASPLARAIADAGYRVEPDLTTPRTVVAYFPCKEEKAKRVARDVTLWEQCALFTALQARWSDNQVSATLTFKPDEADDIEKVLNVYTGKWKSVSFLPLWDHQYPQAPYIPCTEAEYLAAKAAVKPLVLEEDVHDSEDKFCSGGLCELPVT